MSHWIKSEPLQDGGIRIRFSAEIALFWDWLREKHSASFSQQTCPDKVTISDPESAKWFEQMRKEAHAERALALRRMEAIPCGNRGAVELRLDEDSALVFLQCVNDIRLQSWHLLGCPDEPLELPQEQVNLWAYPEDRNAVLLVHELCGYIIEWITGALLGD